MTLTDTDIALNSMTQSILVELIRKSGVREWMVPDTATQLATAARNMALAALGFETDPGPEGDSMTSILGYIEPSSSVKQIALFHASGFSPTTDLRITTDGSKEAPFEIDMTSLGNGAYCQTAKVDFGAVRAPYYAIRGVLELAATPTARTIASMAAAWSANATAASGNLGGTTGSAGAWTGVSSNAADCFAQLDFVGALVMNALATTNLQTMVGGIFECKARYANFVLLNSAGSAFHSSAAKMMIVLDPLYVQGQAA